MEHPPASCRCPGPISRRGFIQAGSLMACGLTLADLLRLRAMAQNQGKPVRETSVILVWLPGGPPHHETYDMKPDAPLEYRGDFRPVKTNVKGIEVCEHLPLHTKCADRYTLIRSIAHTFADHGGGHKRFLTGRDPAEPVGFVNDAPSVLSIANHSLSHRSNDLPQSIALVDGGRGAVDTFSFGAAYLGPGQEPFIVVGDPSAEGYKVQNLELSNTMAARLEDRKTLLGGLDRLRHDSDRKGIMDAMDVFNRKAFQMLTSPQARAAFDLEKEDPKVRDRYGRHVYGQRTLLARRLVEAGVGFVTCVLENPMSGKETPNYTVYNWDSHAVNCHIFDDFKWRAPFYDQAITALVEDVYARGLDKDVMVIVTGEFGRTPKINSASGTRTGSMQPGRDHWPQAMSVLVSGGGMRMGQVIGATNSKGEHPIERLMTPNDLWATAYQFLGIDYTQAIEDRKGRPQYILPFGQPIRELI